MKMEPLDTSNWKRKRMMSNPTVMTISAVVTGFSVFFCCVGTTAMIWFLLPGSNFTIRQDVLWGMIEGIFGAATFATILGGGVLALRQQRQANSIESFDAFTKFVELFMEDELIEARGWIYTNLPHGKALPADYSTQYQKLLDDPKNHKKIKKVLDSLDYLGFIFKHQWLSNSEEIMEWANPIVYKSWVKLAPYIRHVAKIRGEPDYYEAVLKLGDYCARWRTDHNLPDIIWKPQSDENTE